MALVICICLHVLFAEGIICGQSEMYRKFSMRNACNNVIHLPSSVRASKGKILVVLWGVALHCWRKWGNCVFCFWPTTTVARIHFFVVPMKRSAAPFASGHENPTGWQCLWIPDFEKGAHYLSRRLLLLWNLDERWPSLLMLTGLFQL